jgi:hypothetical protein
MLLWPDVIANKRAANADNDTSVFPTSLEIDCQTALESQNRQKEKGQELHFGNWSARRLGMVMDSSCAMKTGE